MFLLEAQSWILFILTIIFTLAPVLRGHGFKPCWSSNFLRLLYSQLHKLLSYLRGSQITWFLIRSLAHEIFHHNFNIHSSWLIRAHKWLASNISGFIAQLVRVSHHYQEVTRLNPVEVLTFSGFYIRNCINCFHNCEHNRLLHFRSAVQYMKYFISNFTFIPYGLLMTHKRPAPNVSVFIAQLVRVSHRYREVTGWNPVEVFTFSGFYIPNCINCSHNCEDHRLRDFSSAVQHMKYFIITSTFIPHGSLEPTND